RLVVGRRFARAGQQVLRRRGFGRGIRFHRRGRGFLRGYLACASRRLLRAGRLGGRGRGFVGLRRRRQVVAVIGEGRHHFVRHGRRALDHHRLGRRGRFVGRRVLDQRHLLRLARAASLAVPAFVALVGVAALAVVPRFAL